MRLVWATDIHLDHTGPEAAELFARNLCDAGDAAVITGDLSNAGRLQRDLLLLGGATPVYFVLGNHDFYGSSVAAVKKLCGELQSCVRWLPAAGVVPLGRSTALVGVDGWADARLGDPLNSGAFLNDFFVIEDLFREVPPVCQHIRAAFRGSARTDMHARMQQLADAEAATARWLLAAALEQYDHVYFATHVPPFREATWHQGQHSDDNWLPYFSCHAVGLALREAATAWPSRRITVLCGHSHGEGHSVILPNLEVFTGGACYKRPQIQKVIDVA